MRIPPGGPATINGILYQMLWSLLEATTIRLQNVSAPDGDIDKATLILEPSRGGDAALIHWGTHRIVQLKARSDGSTWSLRELVFDVLPDLYRVVELEHQQEFVFFTEGRCGDWGEVASFFTSLADMPFPEQGRPVTDLLDDKGMLHYRGASLPSRDIDTVPSDATEVIVETSAPDNAASITAVSRRDLFDRIVFNLRANHRDIRANSEEDTKRKVWRLLSRLKFRWGETQERLRALLLTRLRAIIDNPDATEFTLRSLLTALQEQAARGDAQIEADQFFAEHGLRGVPLARRQWPKLIERGAERLRGMLSTRLRYDSERDVRPGGAALLVAPEIDLWRRGGADCLILAGGSGQGKSWRLYSLACALSEETPVVVVSAEDGLRAATERAAHEFWFGMCNRNTTMVLEQIARHLDATNAVSAGQTWLYILVDGIHTPQDTVRLCREIANIPGVRLAFTASEQTTERVGQVPDAPVSVAMPVHDFTESELRQYVADGDAVRWHAILDKQVRRVIRRPLLAWIYRTLPGASDWNGTNEYRLYDAYLSRHIMGHLSEADLFTAEIAFSRAGLALWQGAPYPWSSEQMREFGFDRDLISALMGVGFLHRDSQQNCYSIWHDRLKEWLAARALSKALVDGGVNIDDVLPRLKTLLFPDQWNPLSEEQQRQMMRYVPMDVIWHLTQRLSKDPRADDILDALLRRFEEEPAHFRLGEALYEGYMPTVGSKIAPAIFRRLVTTTDERDNYRTRNSMTTCLTELDAQVVSPLAVQHLDHGSEDVRYAALTILTKNPIGSALPILWNRLLTLKGELAATRNAPPALTEDAVHGSFERDAYGNLKRELDKVRNALCACVRLSPEWLLLEIGQLPQPTDSNTGADYVSDLLSLLRHTDDQGQLWREIKEKIRRWTETGNTELDVHCQREFARCIYHWCDQAETNWLCARIENGPDRLVNHCLRALIRVAPDVALDSLPNLPQKTIRFTGDWGLRFLLAQRPDETQRRMADMIASEVTRQAYTDVFAGAPDVFSENVLDSLLNFGFSTSDGVGEEESLWWLIDHTNHLVDLPHLQRLWQLAGTDWEKRLIHLYEQVAARDIHDHRLEELARLLFKIGGEGFAHAINIQLISDKYYVRMAGIRYSHLHPNVETIRLLESLALNMQAAQQQNEQEDNEGPHKEWETYAYCAQEALALCRAYKPLIRSVVARQHHSPQSALSAWADGMLPDDDMRPALDALQADPTHLGAILALGVGRRVDFVPHITSVLAGQRTHDDNDITNACHYALVAMPELSPAAVDTLGQRLPYTRSGWLLWHALKRNGSPAALQVLMGYLRIGLEKSGRKGPYSPYDFSDIAEVAQFLLAQPLVQDEALALCQDRFTRETEISGPIGEIVSSLAPYAWRDEWVKNALDCPQVRDYLVRTAFAPQRRKEIRSIQGLAAFTPQDAYAAAIHLLQDEQENVHAPDLLLDIDPVRAIPELFAILTADRTKLRMRHHIAYALTAAVWSDDNYGKTIRDLALKATASSDPRQRRGACFILGFLPPAPDILEGVCALMGDDEVYVYETACAAWNRLETTRSVGELADAFLAEEILSRHWILLHCALRLGDPGDVHSAQVPEWLERMAPRLTPLEWKQAIEKLKKRREKHADTLRQAEERESRGWH